jgi:hypothetical protein
VTLNTCGCCDEPSERPALFNPPGQSALRYRIGVHSSFLRWMLQRLGRETLPDGDHAGERPLYDLTTRATDDFAIALLDAWACVGDVLTFYQERLANESYLPTATERRSILEMARAIGYELRPGVAAEAYLAFTVNAAEGAPTEAPIPAGTQVQSIPQAQGELPQTFETAEAITARAAWNALRPVLSVPQTLAASTTTVYLSGTATNLKAGDMLLLVKSDNSATALRRVQSVAADSANNRTGVTLESQAGFSGAFAVHALREKASIFGHNAPRYNTLPDEIQSEFNDWDSGPFMIWEDSIFGPVYYADADLFLDRAVSGLKVSDYAVLKQGASVAVYQLADVVDASLAGFALSGSSTGLVLKTLSGSLLDDDETDKPSSWKVRTTVVYTKSENLPLAETPVTTDAAAGDEQLQLAGEALGLSTDQYLALSGQTANGDKVSEVRQVKTAVEAGTTTTVTFDGGLENSYVRSSLTVNANVVRASHGETVKDEPLGSGDGAQANQRFKLKKPPLTHLSAATPSGAVAALEVEVDGVEWTQATSLYGQAPEARAFVVSIDDDANATLIFGDGQSGARLPTGQENVTATYRSGIGVVGEVGARTLSLLKTRPFGVTGVVNPLAAEGAQDPETLDGARQNAPVTVLTLDRVVSLRDFEDFARAFAGIGKAQAVAVWTGEREVAHLTIADSQGEVVPEDATVFTNLRDAIDDARDPLRAWVMDSYDALTFNLTARLLIDDAYDFEDVQAAAVAALEAAFAFEQRGFAQPVTSAEIIELLQGVAGVIAVDVDELYRTGEAAGLAAVLSAQPARYDKATGTILPAQLLLLNDAGLSLTQWTVAP